MRIRLAILVLAIFAVSVGLWAADDPLIGTWKLNLAKSKYNPPSGAPKSLTLRYEPEGDGVKLTAEGVDAQGNPTSTQYTAKYDGKDYPVTGNPNWDTIAIKRINASTTAVTNKKAGKVVRTARRVVSRKGKTLTITGKGEFVKGKPFNDIAVYDKQ